MITESDHPNPGLAESCYGCRHKLDKGIDTNEGPTFCAKVLVYEGTVLQRPTIMEIGECMDYGIPSPYDEQLSALLRGRKPAELAELPQGLPSGLSQELLFYANKTARYFQSYKQ